MVSSNFKTKLFSNKAGVEFGILLNAETGMPLHYENLFITISYHKRSRSINTVKACVESLSLLNELSKRLGIDCESEFKKGNYPSEETLRLISDCCWLSKKKVYQLGKSTQHSNIINVHRKEAARGNIIVRTGLVEAGTHEKRLRYIAEYLYWLAKILIPKKLLVLSQCEAIKDKLLENTSSSTQENPCRSLTTYQITELLLVSDIDSSQNPWRSRGVKCRNYLIVMMLVEVGLRIGELLNLKVANYLPTESSLRIWRDADNSRDPRARKPKVKTLSRDVEINEELCELLDIYILKHRANVTGSEKIPFLFISHSSNASPLSYAAIDKMFRDLSKVLNFKVSPHPIRHSWNDRFSEFVDPLISAGDMSEKEAEDLRSYLMGWKEGSGSAVTYTKRYQARQATMYSLKLQRKISESAKQYKFLALEDIDF